MNLKGATRAIFSSEDIVLARVALRLDRHFRHAHEVVRRSHPPSRQLRSVGPSITRFPKPAHCFHPTEDLLNFLSYPLTNSVTLMACGASIDGRTALSSEERRVGKES